MNLKRVQLWNCQFACTLFSELSAANEQARFSQMLIQNELSESDLRALDRIWRSARCDRESLVGFLVRAGWLLPDVALDTWKPWKRFGLETVPNSVLTGEALARLRAILPTEKKTMKRLKYLASVIISTALIGLVAFSWRDQAKASAEGDKDSMSGQIKELQKQVAEL